MADVKKILIFSGIALAVVGGGLFAYKIINDKKKDAEKSDRDAKIAALKATINSPLSTPEDKAAAKTDIRALLAAPLLGIGMKWLDKLLSPKDGKKDPKIPTPTPTPKPTPPNGGGAY
jgi:hypothetical protein